MGVIGVAGIGRSVVGGCVVCKTVVGLSVVSCADAGGAVGG